jgi:beta-lactamase superfamily II metal-dependent hydrolase
LSDALGRRLPLGERQLDFLVVAAPGDDNLTALGSVLPRFPTKQVLWAGGTHGSRAARDLQVYFAEIGLRPVYADAGQTLQLGGGSSLQVLAVSPRGAILLLEWGNFRALLPVGIDFDTLQATASDPELKDLTALLLPESGYAPANPPAWIRSLNPQLVLLSVAADDWRGRPAPETLEAVADYQLLRTDQNGWIQLSTDGDQLWVEVERR